MDKDYETGYRNPPKHTQFQKGQSGNPKGRPKGSKNLKTDLQEELEELILIREGNSQKTVTKQRAIFKGLMSKAMKGDSRAANLIVSMLYRYEEPNTFQEDEDLTIEEEAILAELKAEIARELQKQKPPPAAGKTKRKTSDKRTSGIKKTRRK